MQGHNFKEIMRNKSDEELVRIVTLLRNKYQEQAVKDAEEEVVMRNIDINNFTLPDKDTSSFDFKNALMRVAIGTGAFTIPFLISILVKQIMVDKQWLPSYSLILVLSILALQTTTYLYLKKKRNSIEAKLYLKWTLIFYGFSIFMTIYGKSVL